MLNPSNRTLYSTMLKPPAGYSLDRALGTSYSLDPLMALTIPLQLALFDTDKSINDMVVLYEAIRRVSEKLDIFIDKGRISVPNGTQSLYIMLEPVLHEVSAIGGGAFHPKCWLLRYKDNKSGEFFHRFIVLSRNLTFDRSWDISCCLDEDLSKEKTGSDQNQPIIDLFSSLITHISDSNRRTEADKMLDGLDQIEWEYPDDVKKIDFFVSGINGVPNKRIQMPEAISKMIVSPFCSDNAIQNVIKKPGWKANVLVSRTETLDGLSSDTLNLFKEVYVLADEYLLEEDDEGLDALEGLHAKVFAYNHNRNTSVIYLGSANATNAALEYYNNVEFMVRLEGNFYKLGTEICNEYMGFKDFLVEYKPGDRKPAESDENEKILDELFNTIRNGKYLLYCKEVTEDTSELILKADSFNLHDDRARLYAWPITRGENSSKEIAANEISLGTMSNINLTGLIAFRIQVDSSHEKVFAINIPLENPPENREQLLIRSIIGNKNNFIRYIYMLLSCNDEVSSYEAMHHLFGNGGSSLKGYDYIKLPLLEEMIKTLTTNRESFWAIKSIIDKLPDEDDEIVPADFRILWSEIEKAMEVIDA